MVDFGNIGIGAGSFGANLAQGFAAGRSIKSNKEEDERAKQRAEQSKKIKLFGQKLTAIAGMEGRTRKSDTYADAAKNEQDPEMKKFLNLMSSGTKADPVNTQKIETGLSKAMKAAGKGDEDGAREAYLSVEPLISNLGRKGEFAITISKLEETFGIFNETKKQAALAKQKTLDDEALSTFFVGRINAIKNNASLLNEKSKDGSFLLGTLERNELKKKVKDALGAVRIQAFKSKNDDVISLVETELEGLPKDFKFETKEKRQLRVKKEETKESEARLTRQEDRLKRKEKRDVKREERLVRKEKISESKRKTEISGVISQIKNDLRDLNPKGKPLKAGGFLGFSQKEIDEIKDLQAELKAAQEELTGLSSNLSRFIRK